MTLSQWLKTNYPSLTLFVGDNFLKDCLGPAENFLVSNPSEEAILNYLDQPCSHKRFRNMVLRVFAKIEPEIDQRAEKELDTLEESIGILFRKFKDKGQLNNLANKIRNPNEMWQGMHEIYVAGKLCLISSGIEFEVKNPDRPQNNFDILANIEGYDVNIEVTTRQDDFPPMDGKLHIRATVPPAFSDNYDHKYDKDKISYDEIPESEDLRRRLLDKAIKQLPRGMINVIVLGYGGISDKELHITSALYGDPQFLLNKGKHSKEEKVPNGLFHEGNFAHISAVIYISPHYGYGAIYKSTYASKKLPLAVEQKLKEAFSSNTNSKYRSAFNDQR